MKNGAVQSAEKSRGQMISIEMLHDDALLAVFEFYVQVDEDQGKSNKRAIEQWQTLVHVSRRWRTLVFASSRRLNLRLVCTANTPVKDTLLWPALPLGVQDDLKTRSVENIISVLELTDRVWKIDLDNISKWNMEKLCGVMQKPFPDLTDLRLGAESANILLAPPLQVPNSFLGGSAPRLRSLALGYILFPALPKLLLSTTHLVHLQLLGIPESAYISPEAMVTYLSMMTSLESLSLGPYFYRSPPDLDNRSPSPSHPTRTVLTTLTYFDYLGVSKYIEDFLALVDIPQIDRLKIYIFETDFDGARLSQFVSRTPTLKARDEAVVELHHDRARVKVPLYSQITGPGSGLFLVEFPGKHLDKQLSTLAWVCRSSSSLVSTVKTLYICDDHPRLDDGDLNDKWLELLSSFNNVKQLLLSKGAVQKIAHALRAAGRLIQEVLLTLKGIGLEVTRNHPSSPVHVDIDAFYDAQQLSDFKIEVSFFERG